MAIIGAVLMVAFGTLSPSDALHFVDLGTIVLLFSMMLGAQTLADAAAEAGAPNESTE